MKSLSAAGADGAPALRRAYFDCRYGQLHVYQAIPPGGGFDERTSLLCLPAPQASGALFQPLLARLGENRSVFALDPPGSGQSDPGNGDAQMALAAAAADFLQTMRIRRAHVLADGGAAAAVAALLGATEGRVERVVFCGPGAVALLDSRVKVRTLPLTFAGMVNDGAEAQAAFRQLREFFDADALHSGSP